MGKKQHWKYNLKTKLNRLCGNLYNFPAFWRHEQKKKFYLLDKKKGQLKSCHMSLREFMKPTWSKVDDSEIIYIGEGILIFDSKSRRLRRNSNRDAICIVGISSLKLKAIA